VSPSPASEAAIREAAVEGIQMAGQWLAIRMKQLVNMQCGAVLAKGGKRGHSPPGSPPYKESGFGQSGIGMEKSADGCRVGVPAIGAVPRKGKQPDLSKMPGQNYMAGHDAGVGVVGGARRPWLSLWTRYKPILDRIAIRHLKMRLGAL